MARLYARTLAADVTSLGEVAEVPIAYRNSDRVVGLAWDWVGPISLGGVFDLGDPYDQIGAARELSNNEAGGLASAFDQPTRPQDNPFRNGADGGNMTVAESRFWIKENTGDRFVFVRTTSTGSTQEHVLAPVGAHDRSKLLAVARGLV